MTDTMKKDLEKYSSAYTLSDMEIFIYPELFYPLVLANIMSPAIWKWRDDPWFEKIEKKSFNYKINRIKQYIMDNYVFNLDLETWGLTNKDTEIKRFEKIIDPELLKHSNALFGYEGDKYYFSIDIRKHFGLDQYTDEIIPYWKTETVEAMDAFRYKEGYETGAGECVSLSALYAAAMFVIGKIPLEKIFLIATPLHSQNFVDVKEGIMTNNRRIVTKNMWFNGSILSAKARRALENEKVTIVSHISGHIHTMYKLATIHKKSYEEFAVSLKDFLSTEFTMTNLVNFLRTKRDAWKCFYYMTEVNNRSRYVDMETVFSYERNSKYAFTAEGRKLLLSEIDRQELSFTKKGNKISLNDLEVFLSANEDLSFDEKTDYIFKNLFQHKCSNLRLFFLEFKEFLTIEPKLPENNKEFKTEATLNIKNNHTREEIVDHINQMAPLIPMAELTQYVFRDMVKTEWTPFVKAAIERNPVSNNGLNSLNLESAYEILNAFENISIYEGPRLAQPDEVWNFKRGDGLEKAFSLANYALFKGEKEVRIESSNGRAIVYQRSNVFTFISEKNLKKEIIISGKKIRIVQ